MGTNVCLIYHDEDEHNSGHVVLDHNLVVDENLIVNVLFGLAYPSAT